MLQFSSFSISFHTLRMVIYGSCSKLIKNIQSLKQKVSCYQLDKSVDYLCFHNA